VFFDHRAPAMVEFFRVNRRKGAALPATMLA